MSFLSKLFKRNPPNQKRSPNPNGRNTPPKIISTHTNHSANPIETHQETLNLTFSTGLTEFSASEKVKLGTITRQAISSLLIANISALKNFDGDLDR